MTTHPDKTPVAQDIYTFCTREKTETWHVVRNHSDKGVVDRVVCKSCGSEHKYRLHAKATAMSAAGARTLVRRTPEGVLLSTPSSSPKAGSRSKAHEAAAANLEENWFLALKKWGNQVLRPYNPQEHFRLGEVFEHAHFGKGAVQARRENKVDVLFKEGMKTLPSAKQSE